MDRKIRTYSELIRLATYEERIRYLRLDGTVGFDTFGFDRYLNQNLYHSTYWKEIVRPGIILRDEGRDLALQGYELNDRIIVHHMNPISVSDILDSTEYLFNPEYLVCVSEYTHRIIHYGTKNSDVTIFAERRPNDTCPWKT